MKIKNGYEKLIAVVLTVSIIVTIFSPVIQISAQAEETSIQTIQVVESEDDCVQTTAKPAKPTYEFVINNKEKFFVFMTTPVFWGSNYKVTLACDIDIKGKSFNPIKEFNGVFDGYGYTISNLKVQDKSSKNKNSGLAFINTLNEFSEIKNVTFDNYTIEGNSNINKAAGLVITNHGTVSGVDIINSSIDNIDKKDKAASFVLNNEVDGVIENSFLGNISVKDSNINAGFVRTNFGKMTNNKVALQVNSEDLAGGFVSENAGTIEECSFNGDVESKKIAGGFCGKNSGEIVSCKSEGSVKASAKKGATICGGFVGDNSGIIKECSSTGKVEGQEFTGGFVGINNDKGEISSSKATCDVKSHTYVASIYCGGFAGLGAGKIENCTSNGKVSACVDSEKVLGGTVAGVVLTILTIAGICLLVKYHKLYKTRYFTNKLLNESINKDYSINDLTRGWFSRNNCPIQLEVENDIKLNINKFICKNNIIKRININKCANEFIKSDKLYQCVKNMYNTDFSNVMTDINSSIYNTLQNFFREYYIVFSNAAANQLINNKNIDEAINCGASVVSDFVTNILMDFEKSIKNYKNKLIKDLNNGFIISLGIAFIGGATSGLATRFTAGQKCANVAGFCGFNIGEIIVCRANINSFKAKTLYNKHNMCGGFVGINGETGNIKRCNTTGNEIHNKTYTGGNLGGFVGENIGKIENGTTTVSVTNGKCTGGFCGNNSGEITNSKAEGNAIASAKTVKTKCGGFVGSNNEKGNIDSCTSTGSATGQEYVGGFAGMNKSDIVDCHAIGKATAKTKTHTVLAGGFVGENEKGTIIDCISTGGADSQSSSGQAKAGGFVGINKANIISSKASGYVYLSAGTCQKDDGCGGFVGRNYQGSIIDGCYAECMVETTNKKKGGGFVGEAVCKSTIKNSNCKMKIVTKIGIKNKVKFCYKKDKNGKDIIMENCYEN